MPKMNFFNFVSSPASAQHDTSPKPIQNNPMLLFIPLKQFKTIFIHIKIRLYRIKIIFHRLKLFFIHIKIIFIALKLVLYASKPFKTNFIHIKTGFHRLKLIFMRLKLIFDPTVFPPFLSNQPTGRTDPPHILNRP